MNKHLRYLRYVLAHKFWVCAAAVKMKMYPWEFPRLWLRLVVHDWSKFLPSEWFPYVESFNGGYEWKERPADMVARFDRAWLLHQKRSDHHWQSYSLQQDDGTIVAVEMPESADLEMLCDWAGAGRAINGKWNLAEWYWFNEKKIRLHPATKTVVEGFIKHFFPRIWFHAVVPSGDTNREARARKYAAEQGGEHLRWAWDGNSLKAATDGGWLTLEVDDSTAELVAESGWSISTFVPDNSHSLIAAALGRFGCACEECEAEK